MQISRCHAEARQPELHRPSCHAADQEITGNHHSHEDERLRLLHRSQQAFVLPSSRDFSFSLFQRQDEGDAQPDEAAPVRPAKPRLQQPPEE
jgi:hypothetical protein